MTNRGKLGVLRVCMLAVAVAHFEYPLFFFTLFFLRKSAFYIDCLSGCCPFRFFVFHLFVSFRFVSFISGLVFFCSYPFLAHFLTLSRFIARCFSCTYIFVFCVSFVVFPVICVVTLVSCPCCCRSLPPLTMHLSTTGGNNQYGIGV